MKGYEFREMTMEEIEGKIRDLDDDLFRLRFSAGRGGEANPATKKKIRRDVARAKTILRQRQMEGHEA